MVRGKYFLLSLILHVAILLPIILSHKGGFYGREDGHAGEGRGSREIHVEIISPPSKKDNVASKVEDGKIPVPSKKKIDKGCPNFFGGVGIQVWGIVEGLRVDAVFPGYPAAEAGMMVGDLITWVDGGDIRGEIGSIVNMTILRNGSYINMSIVRGKICY